MSSELSILALYGLLVVVTIIVQVLAAAGQVGLSNLAKPRDDIPDLAGVAARLDRAQKNSITAMALFAPAILLLHIQGGFTANTLLAAQAFLICRAIYVVVYATGTPWIRTAVWSVAFLATASLYVAAL